MNESLIQTSNGWEYQTADDTLETYNTAGQLISVAPRGQAPLTVFYGAAGDPPSSVSDAFGHTLQFAYVLDSTGAQRVGTVTDPSGQAIQYGYDGSGNLSSVTHQDGKVRSYSYGSGYLSHAITTLTDESGTGYATWTYGSSDLVSSSQLAGGVNTYSFTYATSGAGGSISVTDPLGETRNYPQQLIWGSYRMTGSSALCPGCGEDQSRTYDANGNVTRRSDFNGIVTVYNYDVTRNLETSRTEAAGTPQARTIATQWSTSWRQPTQITEPMRTTALSYDGYGNVLTKTVTDTSVTPNVARTWTYTFDAYNHVLTAKGPRTDVNNTTTLTYYICTSGSQCGQLHTITDAGGNVTTYNTYNAYGQPLTITDPNGVVATLTYDARQRLTSRQVGSDMTSIAYYPTGLMQTVTTPDGSRLQYSYDGAHRLTKIQGSLGNSIQYTLDAMGNQTATSTYDPSNVLSTTSSRVFNSLNELSQQIGSAATQSVTTSLGYDSNGNLTQVNAPLNRSTTNTYDALNRVAQSTDPNNGVTAFAYNANGNLSSVNDPRSLTTGSQYDGFGDLLQLVSPVTGTTTNTYDSAGNLKTTTDARGVGGAFTYDVLNRLTQAAYGDQTIALTYDAGTYGKGRLTGASDSTHAMGWQYDALGRVTLKSQTAANITKAVGYAYASGHLTTLTTPSGQTVAYSYTDNRITGISINGTTLLSGVSYEPFGPPRGWTWGNGTGEIRLHDTDGNPTQISAIESTSYTVDSAFRIVGMSNASNAALSWADNYDGLDRITSAAKTGTAITWTYDADGNRTSQAGLPAPTYTQASLSMVYNNRGRMATITAVSTTTAYTYNAIGQRIQKSGATTVLFWYDEAGHLLGEYASNGALIEETVWLGDLPVATLRPDPVSGIDIYYIHADHLNSPKMITRATDNAIMWRWDQDPYGTATPNQNPSSQGTFVYNLRFPGQYFDGESGLSYNYSRDYDPQVGRYVESDPIGLAGGVNTYAYARGNPINLFDLLGLCPSPPLRWNGPPEPQSDALDPLNSLWLAPFAATYAVVSDALSMAQALKDLFSNSNEDSPPPPDYGSTPDGRPFTKHYGTETGPERNIPGSVVDNTINTSPGVPVEGGKIVYYDPVNNVTVVTGDGGSIVSAHKGPP